MTIHSVTLVLSKIKVSIQTLLGTRDISRPLQGGGVFTPLPEQRTQPKIGKYPLRGVFPCRQGVYESHVKSEFASPTN